MIQIRHFFLISAIVFSSCQWSLIAQESEIVLDLRHTIELASDSSLMAFRAQNKYMASYWEHRTFRANRLPSLMLYSTPLRFNRDFTRRYDSEQNIEVYRRQQSFYSYINLAAQQNFDLLGGTFFVDTELGYIRNLGEQTHHQFSSVPIRIGYRQELLGYNKFKWEKKIEPLKFERAKKELISNLETIAQVTTGYFFDLAMAQAEYVLAVENRNHSQRLLEIGKEKNKILSLGQTELLTLKLDHINAKNTLQNAEIRLKRAMFALASYLHLNKDTKITLKLPERPQNITVSVPEALMFARQNNPLYLEHKQQILEAKHTLNKTQWESLFNIGISASIGFNQIAPILREVYHNPLRQDILSVTLTVPLVDWGVRKGKYNMARKQLNITQLSAKEDEFKLEEDLIMTVGDFMVEQQMITSAEEAMKLSKVTYEQTRERFTIGKADINSLTLSANRRQEAQRNYISALKNYWQSYFKLRQLTLYDFEKRKAIDVKFSLDLHK